MYLHCQNIVQPYNNSSSIVENVFFATTNGVGEGGTSENVCRLGDFMLTLLCYTTLFILLFFVFLKVLTSANLLYYEQASYSAMVKNIGTLHFCQIIFWEKWCIVAITNGYKTQKKNHSTQNSKNGLDILCFSNASKINKHL